MKKLIFVSAAIAILLISILSSQYSHGRGGGGHGGGGHGGGGHRGGGGRGGHGYHGGGRGGHGYHGGYGRGGYGRGGYGRGYGGWGYGGWGTGVGVGLTTGLLVGAAASSGGGNTYVNYYPQDNQTDNSQQQDGPPSYVQMTNNTGNMITVKSLTTGDTAAINPGVTTKLEGPSNGFQFEVRDASGKLIRTGASNNGSISIR